jgi:hypothetical protein
MSSWRDIDAVRVNNPSFSMADIARTLKCESAWVRATFKRRAWEPAPRARKGDRFDAAIKAAVIADYRAGYLYREIGWRNGVSTSYVPDLLRRLGVYTPRPRGRKRRIMCDADLWGTP